MILALYNSRAVILHDDPELPVAIAYLHTNIGEYPRFLASIESIIHRLFDSGQIARIFGKLLYGSKFHKLSQSRGQTKALAGVSKPSR
jgi:hypothetical protein